MKVLSTVHIQCSPRYWDIMLPSMIERKIVSKKEAKHIQKVVIECKKRGYEVVPSCDNYDKKTGECLGHKK